MTLGIKYTVVCFSFFVFQFVCLLVVVYTVGGGGSGGVFTVTCSGLEERVGDCIIERSDSCSHDHDVDVACEERVCVCVCVCM